MENFFWVKVVIVISLRVLFWSLINPLYRALISLSEIYCQGEKGHSKRRTLNIERPTLNVE